MIMKNKSILISRFQSLLKTCARIMAYIVTLLFGKVVYLVKGIITTLFWIFLLSLLSVLTMLGFTLFRIYVIFRVTLSLPTKKPGQYDQSRLLRDMSQSI